MDTAAREVSVAAKLNPVSVLEFVVNTRQGMKAYESALTADTDAITFNAALLMLGLERAHAVQPSRNQDPQQARGDAVEIWVETASPSVQRFRAERLMFDKVTNQTIPERPWVYTGSAFLQSAGGRTVFMAEADGVLIGFMHNMATLIEHSDGAGLGRYGSIVLNPNLGLNPDAPLRLVVKALAPAGGQRR